MSAAPIGVSPIDGLVHVRGRVLINETELRFLHTPMPRVNADAPIDKQATAVAGPPAT